MISITRLGHRMVDKILYCLNVTRKLCDQPFHADEELVRSGFELVEDPLKKMYVASFENVDLNNNEGNNRFGFNQRRFLVRDSLLGNVRIDVERILEIFWRNGFDFDFRVALDELKIRLSGILVREVLYGVLREVNCENKSTIAKLAYKFFVWCDQQVGYWHTANTYHLIMQIFAECKEFKAMWRLVDEMIEKYGKEK